MWISTIRHNILLTFLSQWHVACEGYFDEQPAHLVGWGHTPRAKVDLQGSVQKPW